MKKYLSLIIVAYVQVCLTGCGVSSLNTDKDLFDMDGVRKKVANISTASAPQLYMREQKNNEEAATTKQGQFGKMIAVRVAQRAIEERAQQLKAEQHQKRKQEAYRAAKLKPKKKRRHKKTTPIVIAAKKPQRSAKK